MSLLNLGTTCELLEQLDKAIEWHTLVSTHNTSTPHSSSIELHIPLPMQHLSAVVERGDLHGQARALSTLAGIYEETQQMTKAVDHYRKVITGILSLLVFTKLLFLTASSSVLSAW